MKIDKNSISAYDLRSISKITKNGHTLARNRTRSNNPYALSKPKPKGINGVTKRYTL